MADEATSLAYRIRGIAKFWTIAGDSTGRSSFGTSRWRAARTPGGAQGDRPNNLLRASRWDAALPFYSNALRLTRTASNARWRGVRHAAHYNHDRDVGILVLRLRPHEGARRHA